MSATSPVDETDEVIGNNTATAYNFRSGPVSPARNTRMTSMTKTPFDFELARRNMTDNQVRTWEVSDSRVLEVLEDLPRESFVPPRYRKLAYSETAIPIGHGQVMLTPMVEGRILQAVRPHSHESVLEIGTGSGYFTACLARMAHSVTTIDLFDDFIDNARERLQALDLDNIEFSAENAARGPAGSARYDVIVVTAALPQRSDIFHRYLRQGGRLFLIIGDGATKEAWLFTRIQDEQWESESLFDTDLPNIIDPERRPEFVF